MYRNVKIIYCLYQAKELCSGKSLAPFTMETGETTGVVALVLTASLRKRGTEKSTPGDGKMTNDMYVADNNSELRLVTNTINYYYF